MRMLYLLNYKVILLCPPMEECGTSLSEIFDIIFGILTLALAYYVFVYEKKQARKRKNEEDLSRKQAIRLEWYKEIIVQPKIDSVFSFYNKITQISKTANLERMDESLKVALIQEIKNYQSELRKEFLELIQFISTRLYSTLINNLDQLTDALTLLLSDGIIIESTNEAYQRFITEKMQNSYNEFLSLIFNYKG